MDLHSYRDSVSGLDKSANKSDYVNYWDNIGLEKEILRGTKLRETKPRTYKNQNQSAYDVINIDFATPFCRRNKNKEYLRKTSPRKYIEIKTNPDSQRSYSPNSRVGSNSQTYSLMSENISKPITQARPKSRKCSMRTAELAVPSKRQCMETWREKCNVLPEFMVDRLKQQIMDQVPVVHIPDAINCFKQRNKRSTERNNYETWKNIENMMETRRLCETFSHKAAMKLIPPINISLNPQLERISKVVAMDIANILKNGKNVPKDNMINNAILMEIANKVTLWISTVLDDLSVKLLEEDLKAQKSTKRRSKNEINLVTLIEMILNEDSSELEEEEGPVLDLIDDLVDNVLVSCDSNSSDNAKYDSATLRVDQTHDSVIDSTENNSIDTIIHSQNDQNSTTEILNDDKNIEYELCELPEPEDKLMTEKLVLEDFKEDVIIDYFKHEINNIILNFDTEWMHKFENLNHKKQSEIDCDKMAELTKVNDLEPDLDTLKAPLTLNIYENINMQDGINTEIENKEQTNKDTLFNPEIDNLDVGNLLVPLMTETEDLAPKGTADVLFFDSESFTKPVIEHDEEKLQNNLSYEINELMVPNQMLSVSNVDTSITPAIEDHDNFSIDDLREDTALEIGETDPTENSNEIEEDLVSQMDIIDSTDNRDNLNVSEVFQIHSEESPDDKNKKVKFSHIDMVTVDEAALSTVSSNRKIFDDITNEQEQISWKPLFEYIKPLILGPPNELLLSDADELWPRDIQTPTFKISESASRSITSLGKILETDEKILISSDNTSNSEQNTENMLVQDIVIVDKNAEMLSTTNNPKINTTSVEVRDNSILDLKQMESCHSSMPQKANEGNNLLDLAKYITNGMKQTAESEINSSEESKSKKSKEKRLHSNIKTFQDKLVDATKVVLNIGDQIQYNLNSKNVAHREENVILETVKDNFKSPRVLTGTKLNYKANTNTAQLWLSCGNGEPSEDSLHSYYKGTVTQHTKECNYQKWCSDLNQGFVNLEEWNNWIDNASNFIADLNQTRDIRINRAEVEKNWMNLKKSITKDSILWKKLNQLSYERLKIYKTVNKKSKISSPEYCSKCKCKNIEMTSRINKYLSSKTWIDQQTDTLENKKSSNKPFIV